MINKKFGDLTKKLSGIQYDVTCNGSTEPPFTGEYLYNHKTGMYNCVVCGNRLFSSAKKFDSGTGWPSFWDVASKDGSVLLREDDSLGLKRTEVICKKCGSHLGHVFDDGPREHTGLRYCVNSAALKFVPKP
jgi:peptide-methionine (R)-S-oxide reductase